MKQCPKCHDRLYNPRRENCCFACLLGRGTQEKDASIKEKAREEPDLHLRLLSFLVERNSISREKLNDHFCAGWPARRQDIDQVLHNLRRKGLICTGFSAASISSGSFGVEIHSLIDDGGVRLLEAITNKPGISTQELKTIHAIHGDPRVRVISVLINFENKGIIRRPPIRSDTEVDNKARWEMCSWGSDTVPPNEVTPNEVKMKTPEKTSGHWITWRNNLIAGGLVLLVFGMYQMIPPNTVKTHRKDGLISFIYRSQTDNTLSFKDPVTGEFYQWHVGDNVPVTYFSDVKPDEICYVTWKTSTYFRPYDIQAHLTVEHPPPWE